METTMSDNNQSISPAQALNATLDAADATLKGTFQTIGAAPDAKSAQETAKAALQAKEGPAEPVTKEPANEKGQEDKFAQRFAALSRREKAAREQERALQAKIAELEAQQSKYKELESLSERFSKEPLKVYQERGGTLEQLAEMIMNDGNPTEDMKWKEREQSWEAKFKEIEKKLTDRELKEQEAKESEVLTNFKTQIADEIKNNPEYELLRVEDPTGELVYEVIDRHHSETGVILEIKEAADAIEAQLLEEAKKFLDVDKLKKAMGAVKAPAEAKAQERQPSITLSNTESSAVPTKEQRKLSNEQSRAEVAKLLKWNA